MPGFTNRPARAALLRVALVHGYAAWLAAGLAPAHGQTDSPTAPVQSRAQYLVDFWHTEQGLPHNTVTALLQTRDRYLWVGTAAGLVRFDGLSFTTLYDDAIPGLGETRITALLEDRRGGLWIGTQGLGLLRKADGELVRFVACDGQPELDITALAEGPGGYIWIGTPNGLCRWADGRLERFASDVVRSGEAVLALHTGRSGTLWVTTRQSVYRIEQHQATAFSLEDLPPGRIADFIGVYEDTSAGLWIFGATFLLNSSQGVRINYFPSLDPASSRVWTLCEQQDGAIWVGTSGRGLFQFREGRFEIVGASEGLDQCDVRALHTDDEGNLWIGTSGSGLARLRTRPWARWGKAQGLDTTRVTALTRDPEGRPVVGTADAGVLVLRGARFEPLAEGPPLASVARVQALCRDAEGGVWMAAREVGLLRVGGGRQWQFTTADGLGDADVLALAAEHEGSVVWAGTRAGTLHRLEGNRWRSWSVEDGLIGRPILCLYATPGGEVWIGSERGGLLRWDGERVVRAAAPNVLSDVAIRCLMEDRDGRLWVGTDGAGAFCRSPDGWVGLDTSTGLLSDDVGAILQDRSGRYWFAGDHGLSHVQDRSMQDWLTGAAKSVVSLPAAQELEVAGGPGELVTAAMLESADGRLWLAADRGLVELSSSGPQRAVPPRVVIEKAWVNGVETPVSTIRQGRLGPGVRSLDLEFTAVTFSAPERIRFRHLLAGVDPSWTPPDTKRRVHYGPLPPGRYRFEVWAARAGAALPEGGAKLAWVIARPFWQAWWFLLLIGLAGVAAIWSAVHFVSLRQLRARLHRSEQRSAMERERARIARDMHDEIGSKLTRISFLSEVACRTHTPAETTSSPVQAIARTSREVLQALDEIVWVVNPRNDDLTSLAGYLEEYAYQYFQDTPVTCEVSVDPAVGAASLPAEARHNIFLAFEEALGNVLKHARAQQVEISMRQAADSFQIVIADDGAGLGPDADLSRAGHDGMQNMEDRLAAAGGRCTVGRGAERGTRVEFRFPV